jgi:hypothetical protein
MLDIQPTMAHVVEVLDAPPPSVNHLKRAKDWYSSKWWSPWVHGILAVIGAISLLAWFVEWVLGFFRDGC